MIGYYNNPKATDEIVKNHLNIGNDVIVYTGAIICPGVTIGSGSIIGAGSVVTHDIPYNVFAYGVPCRVVRELSPDENVNYGGAM